MIPLLFVVVVSVCHHSAIRSISLFMDFGMMVLADSAGVLAVTDAPTPTNGAVSASFMSSAIPGGPAATRWTPQQGLAKIKAHKSSIISAASVVGCDGLCTRQLQCWQQLVSPPHPQSTQHSLPLHSKTHSLRGFLGLQSKRLEPCCAVLCLALCMLLKQQPL